MNATFQARPPEDVRGVAPLFMRVSGSQQNVCFRTLGLGAVTPQEMWELTLCAWSSYKASNWWCTKVQDRRWQGLTGTRGSEQGTVAIFRAQK